MLGEGPKADCDLVCCGSKRLTTLEKLKARLFMEREGQGDKAGGNGLCGCPRDQLLLSQPQAFLWAPPGGHCPVLRHSSSVGGDVPGVGGRLVTLHLTILL